MQQLGKIATGSAPRPPVQPGGVAALLDSCDWDASPLGPAHQWPQSLTTLLQTALPVKAQIVIFWGPEYVALYNDAYAPTIGDKHPRAFGRPAVENWRELWDDLEPLLRGVRESGETFAAQDRPFYIERHQHGETVYFDVSYSAVREPDGAVGGVLCIVTETTERVQFERRQALLVELGQTLPLLNDPEDIQATLLGRLGEELQAAQLFFAERHGDDQPYCVRQTYCEGRLQRHAPPYPHPPRLHSASGSDLQIPVVCHGTAQAMLVIRFDKPRHCAEATLRMATEAAQMAWSRIVHARAQVALQRSSAQLSAMFDQAGAGIAVCDNDGTFTRLNDRFCSIVGRTRQALLGLRLHDLQQATRPAFGLADTHASDTPQCHIRGDGSSIWLQNHLTPLFDEQGQACGTLCVCVDISERIAAEAQLRELNDGLEERVATMVAQREAAMAQLNEAHKMEMVGQLTGGIAHDFNNLLTPIMASLELIRRRLDADSGTRLVDGALQAADRARILVGRLLTFARRQTLKPQAVALPTLLDDMHELIRRSLGPLIDVRLEIPADLPAVFIDPHQLELALLNLAVNARDAMHEHGRLTIDARLETLQPGQVASLGAGHYIHLRVIDDGSGMDADTLRHCVEPFFSTKGVGKGTGLGLSMVQGLLVQSGGGFAIHSELQQGTQVSLWLPLSEAPAHQAREPVEDDPQAPRPTHVLLVDDENLVRYTTALQLRDLGYQVTEASSALQALTLVDAGLRPDVLVTDHIMEQKTGAQLAQELRQRIARLPVLIITGYANLTPRQISDFEVLAKPFRRSDIAERLARLVSPGAAQTKV